MKKILALVFSVLFALPVLAADYVVGIPGVDLSQSPSVPAYELGIPYWGNEGMFLYTKATEAITAGNWVFVDESNQLTLMDTTESGTEQMRVCVAAATAAANDYIWVWCGFGVFEAILTNALSADTSLTTTGTAGVAGSGGDAITGCINIDAGVTDTRVTVRCVGAPQTNAP